MFKKTYDAVICILVFIILSCVSLQSAENVYQSGSEKEYRHIIFEAEYYDAVDTDRQIKTYNLNAGLGYYPFEKLGLFGMLVLSKNDGYSIDEFNPGLGRMNADSIGLGLAGLLRWHLVRINRFSLFLDGSFGGIYYNNEFPPQGTSWNFMSRYGGGIDHQLNAKTTLGFGYKLMHISNGKGLVDNNPAIDSQSVYVSLKINY